MEGQKRLVQVIHEMQSEIFKLVQENQALRGKLQFGGQKETTREEGAKETPQKEESRNLSNSEEEAPGSLVALRRSVSAGSALTLQEQKDNIMTVRRYSISSVPSLLNNKHHRGDKKNPFKASLEFNGMNKSPVFTSDGPLSNKEDKDCAKISSIKNRSFQDQVFKCRGKVKAVSFLLSPYSGNQDSFNCLQSENTKQLSTIMEKDM
ncbi:putative coiled-coil domain-containing protein 195 [Erythrolamprus reginae]|uniref:putative coiled-coil domain-containing protein 195 n=1 Tax=Erythrolamprus reginae TaxID=121349 RepID=UPI00396C985B